MSKGGDSGFCQLSLTGFDFPAQLSNSRANFRFLVDLRYVAAEGTFSTEQAVMPSLDTFWECDTGKKDKPNYVRASGSPSFDFESTPPKIDPWDRLILVVKCLRLHSVQFKVIDVDRADAWDRVKSFLGGVIQAVVGRAKDQIPVSTPLSDSLGTAVDDIQSFLLKRLAGGDRVLFRGSYTFDQTPDSDSLVVEGQGTKGHYRISFACTDLDESLLPQQP